MKLLNSIKNIGVTSNLSLRERRQVIFNNYLWLFVVCSYLLFTLFLALMNIPYTPALLFALLLVLILYSCIPLLYWKGYHSLGKSIALLSIALLVFFCHHTLGARSGIYLYYFPTLVAAIVMFSWETERKFLIVYVLLILAAYLSGLFAPVNFITTRIPIPEKWRMPFVIFNATLAFVVTVYITVYIIFENIRFIQELDDSKIKLKTLIDNSKGIIWSIDKEYKLMAYNNAFECTMAEFCTENLVAGTGIQHLFPHSDHSEQFLQHYTNTISGQCIFIEYTFNNNWFELNTTPIYDRDGFITGASFYLINITDRKRTTQEAVQAKEKAEEATQIKTRFLANMSHELRTPLNGIIGLTNILLTENKLPSQVQHFEMLKYSSDHMLELINNILDFNKLEAGKLEMEQVSFDLFSETEDLARLFSVSASAKNIAFSFFVDEKAKKWIIGDMMRLRQVLVNLISNAIKFTEKGSVELSITVLEKTTENSHLFQFRITDTGIGIPNDKLTKIFESFSQVDVHTTRKYGGSGLGLTIAEKLIGLMGGKLNVSSSLNTGSTFWFDLSFEVTTPDKRTGGKKSVIALEPFKNLRLLVTEDNAVNRMVAGKILQKWDINVHYAVNGMEAVEKARQIIFDIILMDIEMPLMDGLTATAEIRKFNKTVPIIALTAASYDDLEKDLISKGMNDYVKKPFHPEELHRKIRTNVVL
jgi:PAS domain S-box-containing protein